MTILLPIAISLFSEIVLIVFAAYNKAVPPPIIIPSSKAALVANNASSTLSFFSLISISELPPTLIIATPPISLPNLSCSFSFSNAELALSS